MKVIIYKVHSEKWNVSFFPFVAFPSKLAYKHPLRVSITSEKHLTPSPAIKIQTHDVSILFEYNPLRNMSYKHFLIPPLLVGARYGCADFFVQNLDSAGKLQIHRTVRYAFWGFAQMSVFNPLYMLVYPMVNRI